MKPLTSLLSVLTLGCAGLQGNVSLPEIYTNLVCSEETRALEVLETKPEEIYECKIDTTNFFIPEILGCSVNAGLYFSSEEPFANQEQRERYGLFYTFEPYPERMEHYQQAIERKKNAETPKLDFKLSMGSYYTTSANLKQIETLQKKEKRSKYEEQLLKSLVEKVARVKDVQLILSWEGFYNGEINGVYPQKSVRDYQRFHHLPAHGWVDLETKQQMIMPLGLQVFPERQNILHVLEERIFHAQCRINEKEVYPYVIEDAALDRLVSSAAEQLGLDSIKGTANFFKNNPGEVTVQLKIPERYVQETMSLEMQVIKSKKNRSKTSFTLYAWEDGEKIELFKRRAVVGGPHRVFGIKKEFDTPAGEAYLKRVVVMPHWNPPSWSKEKYGEVSTIPGPLNAYGMFMTELYYSDKIPKDPRAWYMDGDLGFRLHLTASPGSVEGGYGKSHGCVRLHPTDGSRVFYFMLRYTPHLPMKELFKKGEIIPFVPGEMIKVRIKEK